MVCAMYNIIRPPKEDRIPNIEHLKRANKAVIDMCAITERVKAEEQKYRQYIGYVPLQTWGH